MSRDWRMQTRGTVSKKKQLNRYEGEIEVCAHRITYRYRDFEAELTAELKEDLENAAEERVKQSLIDNCVAGELNHLHTPSDEEIRGWWEIRKD
jgi:hypothetical protein